MVIGMLQIPAYAEEETVYEEETAAEEAVIMEETEETALPDETELTEEAAISEEVEVIPDEEEPEAEEPEAVQEEAPEEVIPAETAEEAEPYSIPDLAEKLRLTVTPDKQYVTMRLYASEDVYEQIKNETLYILYTENIGFGDLKDLDAYTSVDMKNAGVQMEWREPGDNHWGNYYDSRTQSYVYNLGITFTTRMSTDYDIAIALRTGDLTEQGEENSSAMCCLYDIIVDGCYKLITDYYTFRTEDPLEETQVKITDVKVSNGYAYSGVSILYDNPLTEQIQRTGYLDEGNEVHWFAGSSASEKIDGRYRSYSVLLNNGRTFKIRPFVRVQMSDDYDDYQDVIGEEVEITFVPFTNDLIVRQEGSGAGMFWADITMTEYSMADTAMQPKLYYRKKGTAEFTGPKSANFSGDTGKAHIIVTGLESGAEYEYYVKVDARESFDTTYVQTLWSDGTPEAPLSITVGETRTLTEADFTDPLLYQYLVKKYGRSGTLTTGSLAGTSNLSMMWSEGQFERPLYSLDGIEYFSHLTAVNAEGHDLTDLDVLKDLPDLKTVSVSNNRIDTLPDLSGTSIVNLDLSGNLLDEDDLKAEYLPATLSQAPEQFISSTLAAQRRSDFRFAGTYYGLNGKSPFFFELGAQKTRDFTAEISGNGKSVTVQIPSSDEDIHEFLLVNDLKEAGIVTEYGTNELTVTLTDGFGYSYSQTCTAEFTEEPVFMENAEANAGYSTSMKAELFGTYTKDQLTVEFIDKTDPSKVYSAENIYASQLITTERYSDQGFARVTFRDKTTSVSFYTGKNLPAGAYTVRITAPDRTYTSGAIVTVHDVSEQFVVSQTTIDSNAPGVGDQYVAVFVTLNNGSPADIVPVLYKDGEQISEKPAVRVTPQTDGRYLYVLKKTGSAWNADRVSGTIEIESVSGAEFLDIRTNKNFSYGSSAPHQQTRVTFAAYNYRKEQFEYAFTSDVAENTPVSVSLSVYDTKTKEYVETAKGSGTVGPDHVLALKLYTIDTEEEYTIRRNTRARTVCSSESFTSDITNEPLFIQYCNTAEADYPEEEGVYFVNNPDEGYFDRLYAYGIGNADIVVEFWTEGSTRLVKTLSLKAADEQEWTYLFTAEDLEGLSEDEIYAAKAYVSLTTMTATGTGYFGVSEESQGPVHVTSVKLSEESLDLGIGEMHELTAEVLPANAENKEVSWSSSDKTVASVENGKVYALNAGTAVITVTTADGNKTAQCTVTVSKIDAESVSFTAPESIKVGELTDLDPVFVPANTTNRNVVWSTSDSSIAVVDEDGVVKGIKAGTVTITMTAEESGLSYAKEITVIQPVKKIVLSSSEEILLVDDSMQLEAEVLPEDASNKNIVWSSDHEEIASVDEDGVVYALQEGKAVITAASEDGNAKASCIITVMSNEMYPGIYIKGLESSYTYTGSAIKPEFDVYDNSVNLTIEKLRPKTDYTVTYKNTTKAYTVADPDHPTAADKKKAPQIIIKSNSKGNYTGSKTVYFSIEPLDINDERITVDELSVQTGAKPVSPVPVVYFNGKKLKARTDFTVDYNGWDQKEAGDHKILINGVNNFSGTREITVHAADELVSVAKLSVSAKTLKYADLTEENFEEKVKEAITVKQGKNALTLDADYTIEDISAEDRKVGSFTVTLVGDEDHGFYGRRTVTVKITGIALSDKKVKAKTGLSYPYTGDEITFTPETHLVSYNGVDLTEGTDYVIDSYIKNLNAGTATVTLQGINSYTGTKKVSFKITPDTTAHTRKITVEPAVYAKGGSKPKVTVEGLTEGTDYTVKYGKNNAAGKAGTATVTFKGNYKGSKSVPLTFNVEYKDLSEVTITAKDLVYKQGKYQSTPVLKDTDGKTLKAGVDYEKTYEYSGNIIDGDAQPGAEITVTVTGKGNYTGTASAKYRILETGKDISKMTFKIKDKEYIGAPVYLSDDDITVMLGKTKIDLSEISYIVTDYKNNVNKGTASVTFRGVGDYGGEKTVTFKIKVRSILSNWFDGFGYLKIAGHNVSYMTESDVTIDFTGAKMRTETLKFMSMEDGQVHDYQVNVIRVKPGSFALINDSVNGNTTDAYPFAYHDGYYEGYARGITISSGDVSTWPTTVFHNGDVIGLFYVELTDNYTGNSSYYYIMIDR